MFKLDKNTTTIVLALIAAVGAGGEQRLAVSRLESKVDALAQDVAEMQRELRPRVATTDAGTE